MEDYTRLLSEFKILVAPEDNRSAEEILSALGYLGVIREVDVAQCDGQQTLFETDDEEDFWDNALRNAM